MQVDPNGSGRLQFSQYAYDDDGDTLEASLDVFLQAVGGVLQGPADQRPSWLTDNVTTAETALADGRTQLEIIFDLPADRLEADVTYEIAVSVQDATHPSVLGAFNLNTTQT